MKNPLCNNIRNVPNRINTDSSVRPSVLVLAVSAMLAFSSLSLAGAGCKGLQEDACNGVKSCSWIKSYTTKKGKTINAYCRNSPKRTTGKKAPDKGVAVMRDKKG